MFSHALRVTLALMLFRSGPQDFPFSIQLSRSCALIALLAGVLMMAPMISMPLALAMSLGGVAGMALFTRKLLRARQLENRLAQTLGAQYLCGGLFALAMWPAVQAAAPEMIRVFGDPAMVEKIRAGQPVEIAMPPWAGYLSDLLFIWSVAVSVRINRLAADLSVPTGLLLTLAGLLVMMSCAVLFAIFFGIFGLVPVPATAAG